MGLFCVAFLAQHGLTCLLLSQQKRAAWHSQEQCRGIAHQGNGVGHLVVAWDVTGGGGGKTK